MKSMLLELIGVALVQAILTLLVEEERFRLLLRLIGGVAMAVILLRAVTNFDDAAYAAAQRKLQFSGAWDAGAAETERQRLDRLFIEAECEAYIADRANEMGMALSGIEVSLDWSTEGYWYPARVTITAPNGEMGMQALADEIYASLGITPENQTWREEGAMHEPQ